MTSPNTTLNYLQMMSAHIHLGLGIFDDVQDYDNLVVATSSSIHDYYWNFAYKNSENPLAENEIELASALLREKGRTPALWIPSIQDLPQSWKIKSREAWMWLDKNARSILDQPVIDNKLLEIRETNKPTLEMLHVFQNAYGSSVGKDDIGYTELPPEYGESYLKLQPKLPAQMCHFAAYLDGGCVAIATVIIWKHYAGLYSVATHHDYRRRGFGREISRVASLWAMQQNIDGILLQTEAESVVEKMYRQLGYQKTHTGLLVTQK